MTQSVLAIIGGGRWGQVLVSIAAKMQSPFDKIVIVSQANAAEVANTIAKLNPTGLIPVEIAATIEDLLANNHVTAAIVANAALHHFAAAQQLIANGVHLLIEKPVVTTVQQMTSLIQLAAQHDVCLVPGLSYRFCSYLENYAREVAHQGKLRKFFLKWSDAGNEIRYGQVKKFDAKISVVQDVMPHIFTILSVVLRSTSFTIESCEQDNTQAMLTMMMNNIRGRVELQRNAEQRQRFLSVEFASGKTLALDFTREPGVVLDGDGQTSGDVEWEQKPSPLTRQLQYFFTTLATGKSSPEDLLYCLNSVSCTETAAAFRLRSPLHA